MILTIEQQQWVELAKEAAREAQIDPILFCAIVEQESGWDTWAIRYEPDFFNRYIAAQTSLHPTEARARAFSYGLCQVMGQVAREHGFDGKWLTEMCDPKIGLPVGAEVFASKLKAAQEDVTKALLKWNGGSNILYPNQVLGRIAHYQ